MLLNLFSPCSSVFKDRMVSSRIVEGWREDYFSTRTELVQVGFLTCDSKSCEG